MSDERIVPCEACASEGRILRGSYDDERDCGPCPFCEGTGDEIIETQPVQQGEIEAREECASEGNASASALPADRLVQPQSLGCGDSPRSENQS